MLSFTTKVLLVILLAESEVSLSDPVFPSDSLILSNGHGFPGISKSEYILRLKNAKMN
jgi:hypothetical protein